MDGAASVSAFMWKYRKQNPLHCLNITGLVYQDSIQFNKLFLAFLSELHMNATSGVSIYPLWVFFMAMHSLATGAGVLPFVDLIPFPPPY
jgi:hypothetical protein